MRSTSSATIRWTTDRGLHGHSLGRLADVPVNPDLQGRVFPSTSPYLVCREKVREFARAVFATNPVNLDPVAATDAGYADIVAPPTFAVVVQEYTLAQLLAEPDAGIDFSRVVHGDQRFTFVRPFRAGDVVIAKVTIDRVRVRAGSELISATVDMSGRDGEEIRSAQATFYHAREALA